MRRHSSLLGVNARPPRLTFQNSTGCQLESRSASRKSNHSFASAIALPIVLGLLCRASTLSDLATGGYRIARWTGCRDWI